MEGGARVYGVHAAGFIVFIPLRKLVSGDEDDVECQLGLPRAAVVFPDGVFDPFLQIISTAFGMVKVVVTTYLDMIVELVGDVLLGHEAADIFVLHLLNPLDGVL